MNKPYLPLGLSVLLVFSFTVIVVAILPSIPAFQPPTATPVVIPPFSLQSVVITLERTRCFGECPVYVLTIRGDGTVIFDGKEFVWSHGKHYAVIGQQQIRDLVGEFYRIDFFSLPHFTNVDFTDFPSAVTTITVNGTTKSVSHYHGDEAAPHELYELERKIDEAANSNYWIGR